MRAKVTPLWTKFKLWLSPTFWKTRGVGQLRSFFSRLFDVRPRHKKDYYSLFRWLVSKRLAFALIVTLGALAAWYVLAMSPLAPAAASAGNQIPTYRYSAFALKFYSGEVQILAKDGHVAYVGEVEDGRANGRGKLYGPQDDLLYAGAFQSSMYEGAGELYYPDGGLHYTGEFSKNLFHGTGEAYRPEGTLEYRGGYAAGLKSGRGELFNAGGNRIFSGTFQADALVYAEFVGKTTAETAEMYLGKNVTYSTETEHCVEMEEIGALYAARPGDQSLDEAWTVGAVYVLQDSVFLGGRKIETVAELRESLGAPEYAGQTWVTLPDAVALNRLEQDRLAPVDMKKDAAFDDVFQVSEYDGDRQVYIYVFRANGLTYTFFCAEAGAPDFLMYSIEQ